MRCASHLNAAFWFKQGAQNTQSFCGGSVQIRADHCTRRDRAVRLDSPSFGFRNCFSNLSIAFYAIEKLKSGFGLNVCPTSSMALAVQIVKPLLM